MEKLLERAAVVRVDGQLNKLIYFRIGYSITPLLELLLRDCFSWHSRHSKIDLQRPLAHNLIVQNEMFIRTQMMFGTKSYNVISKLQRWQRWLLKLAC